MLSSLIRRSNIEYMIRGLQLVKKTMKDQAKPRTKICSTLLKDNIILDYSYTPGYAEGQKL
jgi:hypothetical protein